MSMERSFIERGAPLLAVVLVLLFNGLANWLPIGGLKTGEVSALYASTFTPAGFTFSIWAVIYSGLLGYAVYQALPGQSHSELLRDVGLLVLINCLLNCAWLVAWHFQFLGISMLLMLLILWTLVRIYARIYGTPCSLIVRLPFSIYLAWITVAAIANISALQTSLDLNDYLFSAIHWTLLKLSFAGAVGAYMLLLQRDIAFVLVIAWAAFGVSAEQQTFQQVQGAAQAVCLTSLLLAVIGVVRLRSEASR